MRQLPDRAAIASDAAIADAFVAFILYCNPAVPVRTGTAALREAFLAPPRSGGKSFSTFALFGLIRRLESRELKTWADLVLRLGVEPPDQEKGQSSQRIQQYAARLKVGTRSGPNSGLALGERPATTRQSSRLPGRLWMRPATCT